VRITWTLTGVGWAEVRVGDDRAEAALTASYVSGEAAQELLLAVCRLAAGSAEARAQFEAEPAAFRWIFTRDGDQAHVRVLRLPDGDLHDSAGTEIWGTVQPVDTVVRAVVRCFDEVFSTYGGSTYEASWRSPFPREELERLRSTWRDRTVRADAGPGVSDPPGRNGP
jgi:hypothetical protein